MICLKQKINELECFCSQCEESPNESDHSCQDQTLQTKAACSFIHELKKPLKDILFKEKQNKESDRKRNNGIILSGEESPNRTITTYSPSLWKTCKCKSRGT